MDVAGRRARRPSLLFRSRPPVRRGPAPRDRHRRVERDRRACAGRRHRDVRRDCSERRQDDLDRDAVGVHRDVAPPWVDRRVAKRARRRGRRRGNRRRRVLRLLRPQGDPESAGIRRPTGIPAASPRDDGCRGYCSCAAASGGTCAGSRRAPQRGRCGSGNTGVEWRRTSAGGRSCHAGGSRHVAVRAGYGAACVGRCGARSSFVRLVVDRRRRSPNDAERGDARRGCTDSPHIGRGDTAGCRNAASIGRRHRAAASCPGIVDRRDRPDPVGTPPARRGRERRPVDRARRSFRARALGRGRGRTRHRGPGCVARPYEDDSHRHVPTRRPSAARRLDRRSALARGGVRASPPAAKSATTGSYDVHPRPFPRTGADP
jgi:hypothetical protein